MNDLKLKGIDLLIYAIIYGFSQDGSSVFSGSIRYLQDWTNASRRAVQMSLKSLCDRGLIKKMSRDGGTSVYVSNESDWKNKVISEWFCY